MGIVLSVCIVFPEIDLIASPSYRVLILAGTSQNSVPKPGFHHLFLSSKERNGKGVIKQEP